MVDFYGVPRDRLAELRDAAKGSWARIGRNRERWNAMVASLPRPDRLFPGGPDGYPAEAGEHMLRDIALLRTALINLRPESILLIHLHFHS